MERTVLPVVKVAVQMPTVCCPTFVVVSMVTSLAQPTVPFVFHSVPVAAPTVTVLLQDFVCATWVTSKQTPLAWFASKLECSRVYYRLLYICSSGLNSSLVV